MGYLIHCISFGYFPYINGRICYFPVSAEVISQNDDDDAQSKFSYIYAYFQYVSMTASDWAIEPGRI